MPYEEVFLRLAISVIVGGAIGYEREYKNRPAGFRTHILVSLGATVIALIQVNINEEMIRRVILNPALTNILKADYARLSAQVISGIGFLGAGTIIHHKGSIKGLTTAATLWVVACIGLAVGYGFYLISIAALIFTQLVLISLKRFQTKIFHASEHIKLEVEFIKRSKGIEFIDQYFDIHKIHVLSMEFHTTEEEPVKKTCVYTLSLPKYVNHLDLIIDIGDNENIKDITELDLKA